jgi:tRNA U34 5-carboxymethylaminomethyl modifying GTPase MnmE/TrmE
MGVKVIAGTDGIFAVAAALGENSICVLRKSG